MPDRVRVISLGHQEGTTVNPRSAVCALLLAATVPAFAQGFIHGSKPADEKKVLRNTAEALGLDEEDITLSDLEREGMMTRYRARLKDGTEYRCKIASAGGLTRIMSFGADYTTSAECVKRVGSGKGPEPAKSPAQKELDRRRGG